MNLEKTEAQGLGARDNPVILALPDPDKEIWQMHRNGVPGSEIGLFFGMGKDRVCRILQSVRQRIRFLADFRNVLQTDHEALARFMGCSCSVCKWPECPKEEK